MPDTSAAGPSHIAVLHAQSALTFLAAILAAINAAMAAGGDADRTPPRREI